MERPEFYARVPVLLGVTLMMLSACAFKQDEPVAAAKASVVEQPKGSVSLDAGSARTLTRDEDQIWHSEVPLFVAASPPEKLTLHLKIPSEVQAKARQVTAEIGLKESTQSLKVEWSPEESGISVSLQGIAGLLKDQDSVLPLSVRVWAEGSAQESVQLLLRTPPNSPRLIPLTIQEWRAYGRRLARGVEHIRSGSTNLSLLQIVEVTHPSDLPVAVSFPIRLSGTLSATVVQKLINQDRCSFSTTNIQSQDIFTDVLYLLPLTDDIQDRLSNYINDGLAENASLTAIKPGESAIFGIYGAGDRLTPISDSGFKPRRYIQADVVSSCHTICGVAGDVWAGDMSPWAFANWQRDGFPGGSAKCAKAMCVPHRISDQFPYTPDLCTECALWETSTGRVWWDVDRRFCFAFGPGDTVHHGQTTEPWRINPVPGLSPAGYQDSSLVLRIAQASRKLGIRFLGADLTEAAPVREVSETLPAELVQGQGAN